MGRLDIELEKDFAEYERGKGRPENRDGGLTRQLERVASRNLASSLRGVQLQLRACQTDLQNARTVGDKTRIEREIATLQAREIELSQKLGTAEVQVKKSAETLQTPPEVKAVQTSTKARALTPRQAPKMPVLSKTETLEKRLRDYIVISAKSYVTLAANSIFKPEKLLPFENQLAALPEESRMKPALQRILKALLSNKKLDDGMRLIRELEAL